MSLVMYERLGHDDRRPSPFSWRIRHASLIREDCG
jgi:hypothetical protein